MLRLRPAGRRVKTELVGGDAKDEAEEFAVAHADALGAAFPFGDHVGVDSDASAVPHQVRAGEAGGDVVSGATTVVAWLA